MAEETTNQGNIKPEFNVAQAGLNLDQSVNQVPKGKLTYALNAAVENFDANSTILVFNWAALIVCPCFDNKGITTPT